MLTWTYHITQTFRSKSLKKRRRKKNITELFGKLIPSQRDSDSYYQNERTKGLKINEQEKMLAATLCRDLHFSVLPATINSRVPRCLFGSPSSKETRDLLQDALDVERTRFSSKWGIDPRSENDKENILPRFEKVERSPRKRFSPYTRQTNIHEYWRSRKLCEISKKSANILENSNNKQQSTESMGSTLN